MKIQDILQYLIILGFDSPLSAEWLYEILQARIQGGKKKYRGDPFPSPGDLLNQRIKPRSPALQADSLPGKPWMSPVSVNSLPTQESQMEPKYKPSVAKIQVLGYLSLAVGLWASFYTVSYKFRISSVEWKK